jgi:tetratricopeptide (TPR) repeat protein
VKKINNQFLSSRLTVLGLFTSLVGCAYTHQMSEKIFPTDATYNETVVKADAAMRGGDFVNAVALYKNAIQIKPQVIQNYIQAAEAEQKAGNFSDAAELYQHVIEMDVPNDPLSQHLKEYAMDALHQPDFAGIVAQQPQVQEEVQEDSASKQEALSSEEDVQVEEVAPSEELSVQDSPQDKPQDNPEDESQKSVDISPVNQFNDFLTAWVHAWESKNFKQYLSFYADEFQGDQAIHQTWQQDRYKKLTKNEDVHLNLTELHIEVVSPTVVMLSFHQRYHSSRYQDEGLKKLTLHQVNGNWKIVKESFVAK